jgi:hypothetical protein
MDKKYQVFISSTYWDMKDERQAAVTAILEDGHIPAGMELFAASDKKQMDVIKRWINESDVFMLILGGRYGSIESESGKSYVHLEYEYAVEIGKPFFALYLTDDALNEKARGELGIKAVERDHSGKYNDFRALVRSKLCTEVNVPLDIRVAVPKSIKSLATENNLRGWVRAPIDAKATERAANKPADPKIELFTSTNPPYHADEFHSGQTQSIVRVGIRNVGGKTLSNCKVYVERIYPNLKSPTSTFVLDNSGFHLRPDDPEKLIDVAAHWESWDKYTFSTPPAGGFFDSSVYIDDGAKRTFTLKVKATECECNGIFEIWADDLKKLHLRFIEYVS